MNVLGMCRRRPQMAEAGTLPSPCGIARFPRPHESAQGRRPRRGRARCRTPRRLVGLSWLTQSPQSSRAGFSSGGRIRSSPVLAFAASLTRLPRAPAILRLDPRGCDGQPPLRGLLLCAPGSCQPSRPRALRARRAPVEAAGAARWRYAPRQSLSPNSSALSVRSTASSWSSRRRSPVLVSRRIQAHGGNDPAAVLSGRGLPPAAGLLFRAAPLEALATPCFAFRTVPVPERTRARNCSGRRFPLGTRPRLALPASPTGRRSFALPSRPTADRTKICDVMCGGGPADARSSNTPARAQPSGA